MRNDDFTGMDAVVGPTWILVNSQTWLFFMVIALICLPRGEISVDLEGSKHPAGMVLCCCLSNWDDNLTT